MFRGISPLTLDSKGRLAVPARHREALARQCEGMLVVTVDYDGCLLLYPLPEWEEIERKLVRLPSFNEHSRRMQRVFLGHATECELDGNGRVLLPPPLRAYAKLEKAVVLVGQGNRFEIWDEATWNSRRGEWLAAGVGGGNVPPEIESLSL